jgi:hypothetical protein
MATFYPSTIDYSKRQVDIELLQSVEKPTEMVRVILGLATTTPKIVTGIQKVAQRYALLFLSTVGEVRFAPNQGALILSQVGGGRIQNRGQLQVAFAASNSTVLNQMKSDDSQFETYGEIPDDERILDAILLDFDIDFATSVVYLRVRLLTGAGTDIIYVVPVTAART